MTAHSSKFLESDVNLEYGFQKFLALCLQTSHQRQFERQVNLSPLNDELAPVRFEGLISGFVDGQLVFDVLHPGTLKMFTNVDRNRFVTGKKMGPIVSSADRNAEKKAHWFKDLFFQHFGMILAGIT